jgi:uncharacterized SAM-binding protein YcdF (DUF218 family)
MNIEKGSLDYIVALGKNWARPSEYKPRKDGKPRQRTPKKLSLESRITAISAGMLASEKVANKIVFSTGKTAGTNPDTGQDFPSESEEMARYMKIRFPQVLDEQIVLQDRSFDTAGDAEESGKIVHGNKFGLLTVGFHLGSSAKLFKNFGNTANELFKSEDVLTLRSRRHADFIRKYKKSIRERSKRILEYPRYILVNTIDSNGNGLRMVTRVLRHRA